jgi:hypothetical protein
MRKCELCSCFSTFRCVFCAFCSLTCSGVLLRPDRLDCNLEVWLDSIADVTFPTKFVPLSVSDAAFLCRAYKELKRDAALSPANQQLLAALTAKLQTVIEDVRASPQ